MQHDEWVSGALTARCGVFEDPLKNKGDKTRVQAQPTASQHSGCQEEGVADDGFRLVSQT